MAPKEADMRTINCPLCKGEIVVPDFSRAEELANGKHIFCPEYGYMIWVPLQANIKPTAFPNAVTPSGQPWITARTTV